MLGQGGQVVVLTIRMNEQVDELFLDLVAHKLPYCATRRAHRRRAKQQIIKVREGHCPADVEVLAAPRNTTRFVAARLPPPPPPATVSPTLTLTLTLTLNPPRSAALPVVRLPPNSWLGSSLTRGSVRFY